jgi:hypothetical protein
MSVTLTSSDCPINPQPEDFYTVTLDDEMSSMEVTYAEGHEATRCVLDASGAFACDVSTLDFTLVRSGGAHIGIARSHHAVGDWEGATLHMESTYTMTCTDGCDTFAPCTTTTSEEGVATAIENAAPGPGSILIH